MKIKDFRLSGFSVNRFIKSIIQINRFKNCGESKYP